ncbi:putative Nudix hydrolase [Giardia muris]|uniref:Putative Nudix hydrolase n=1 Tax=Giardia muris TaxID=5742 RepID=A0A4Z1SNJ5_GIAMU|nr:putative Nudix hydrolase [Giardia muris]|eukprot:TNJ26445.1 putative Nudix hydrolase [Giardia muris]
MPTDPTIRLCNVEYFESTGLIERFYNLSMELSGLASKPDFHPTLINLIYKAFFYYIDNLDRRREEGAQYVSSMETNYVIQFLLTYVEVLRNRGRLAPHIVDNWNEFIRLFRERFYTRCRARGKKQRKVAVMMVDDSLEYVLLLRPCRTSTDRSQSLPKGSIDGIEQPIEAAIREAYEETQVYVAPYLYDPFCVYFSNIKARMAVCPWLISKLNRYDFLAGFAIITRTEPEPYVESQSQITTYYFVAPGISRSVLQDARPLSSEEIEATYVHPIATTLAADDWRGHNLTPKQGTATKELLRRVSGLRKRRGVLPAPRLNSKAQLDDWQFLSFLAAL